MSAYVAVVSFERFWAQFLHHFSFYVHAATVNSNDVFAKTTEPGKYDKKDRRKFRNNGLSVFCACALTL